MTGEQEDARVGEARLGESRLGELEAALFASPRPLSASALARRLELPEPEVVMLLDRYAQALRAPGRGLQLREARGGWALATKPEHEDVVRAAWQERGELPLTAAARETLAAVLLLQPVATREVNRQRGRDSAAPLATLQRRGLIARSPRPDREAGLWRTSGKLLEACGVQSLEELHRDGAFAHVFQRLRGNAEDSKAGLRSSSRVRRGAEQPGAKDSLSETRLCGVNSPASPTSSSALSLKLNLWVI